MADKALLTGINKYKSISHLRGCINDVHTVQSLLADVFDFPAANIRTLTDSQVTKERIQKEWNWLVKDARAGDRLVFHFSGHGTYIADEDADEDDGVDELICLYDMDFDDGSTYLLDDDLRKLTAKVPEGVFLTVLLDSCHSGTATRMLIPPTEARGLAAEGMPPLVDLQVSMARLRANARASETPARRDPERQIEDILAPQRLSQARDTVLARFVEPPANVLAALRQGGIRKSLRSAMAEAAGDEEMNHVLVSGSEATQTSADAFIEGDYHGAFSFYLNRTIRNAGRELDHQSLIRDLRKTLADNEFSQIPQLEPEHTSGPFLVRTRGSAGASSATVKPAAGAMPGSQGYSLDHTVSLLKEIRDLLAQQSNGDAKHRHLGQRAIVFVHGICQHDDTFADPWWDALRPHLSQTIRQQLEQNRHPVVWSDLVNRERAARGSVDPREAARERELENLICDVLQDRSMREALTSIEPQPADRAPRDSNGFGDRAFLGIPGANCIDDFVKYLLDDSIRRAVQQRFLNVVVPLLQSGMSIEVMSHSWGSVIAYEALRSMDGEQFSGAIHNFFTIGSALSIVPVQRRLQPSDCRRPQHARRWINIDAHGDVVGGSLGSTFPVDTEYLNLHPTQCPVRFGLVAPLCAHTSYFDAQNVPVNRDIFASHIDGE